MARETRAPHLDASATLLPDRPHKTDRPGQTAKDPPLQVSVRPAEGQALNGLGMMLLQYLEQNLHEFGDKREAAQRLRGRVSVEVERGIATTVSFLGNAIEIGNGISPSPDLHLKGSYLLLSKILAGKANPYLEVVRGNIKLLAFPRRPLQSVRVLGFLKIPSELLLEPLPSRGKTYALWAVGSLFGAGAIGLLIYVLFQMSGG
ncbi:MAG: hypothetical protein AB1640_07650 [bacterium]